MLKILSCFKADSLFKGIINQVLNINLIIFIYLPCLKKKMKKLKKILVATLLFLTGLSIIGCSKSSSSNNGTNSSSNQNPNTFTVGSKTYNLTLSSRAGTTSEVGYYSIINGGVNFCDLVFYFDQVPTSNKSYTVSNQSGGSLVKIQVIQGVSGTSTTYFSTSSGETINAIVNNGKITLSCPKTINLLEFNYGIQTTTLNFSGGLTEK